VARSDELRQVPDFRRGVEMPKQEVRSMLPPIWQIGILVGDVDEAVEYTSSRFGWGPFRVEEFQLTDAIFRGQPRSWRMKAAFANRPGPVEIELIQVLEADPDIREFYWSKGGGLHHLGFLVKDLDGILAELAEDGIEPVWHHRLPGVRLAFVNIDKIGGVCYELVEVKKRIVNPMP